MTQAELNPSLSRQFVAPYDFEVKLTSRSRLVRADDRTADAMGLLDLETGVHILVSRIEWLKYHQLNHRVKFTA